jgi:hypothetical protein
MHKRLIPALLIIVLAAASSPADTREPVQVTGSYWYVVDHITQVDEGARVRVWMSMPGDRPGQDVKIRNIDPRPTEILVDHDHGNRVAYWDVTPAPDAKILFFRYDFDATLTPVSMAVEGDDIGPYDRTSTVFTRYTAASDLIRIDGEIESAARRIVGEETHPQRRAKRIFDWMVANLEFVPGGVPDRDTLGTLQSRRGDCGQYSRLFTALCRSLGIPARTVTTHWLSGGMHRLAEFYLPSHGWVPVDIAVAQVMVEERSLFSPAEAKLFAKEKAIPVMDPDWHFGNMPASQLALAVGNDMELAPSDGTEAMIFATLEPGGDRAAPPAVIIEGLGDEYVPGGFVAWGSLLDEEQAHDMTHQKLVSRFLSKGLYDVAEQGCLQMQESDPDGITSWMNLGLVNLRKGLFDKAEACFNRALRGHATGQREKYESVIWAHNYLGNCYDLMGRRELAVAQYTEVVEMDNHYRGAVDYARLYLGAPFTTADFH